MELTKEEFEIISMIRDARITKDVLVLLKHIIQEIKDKR